MQHIRFTLLYSVLSSEMLLKEPVIPSAHLQNNGNVNSDDNTSEKQSWINDQRKIVKYEGNNHNTIDDTYINNSMNFEKDAYDDVTDSLTVSNLERQLKNENDAASCDNSSSNKSALKTSDACNEICETQNKNLIIVRGGESPHDDNIQCLQEATQISNSTLYDYTSDEGLFEYEEGDSCSSSTDMSPQDEERMLDASDSDDSFNNHRPHPLPRGIHNPNYPGFQHLAYTLQEYSVVSPIYFENGCILPNKYNKSDDTKDQEQFSCSEDPNKINYFSEERETNNNDSSFENACNSNDKLNCATDNLNKRNNINYSEPIPITSPIDVKHNGTIVISHSIRHQNNEKHYINNAEDKNCNGNISALSLNQRIPLNYVNNILDNSTHNFEKDLEENCKLNTSNGSDFQEDLIALQREIYETIQKPLANTLQNISEVVNNVINCIAEEHHDTDCVNWITALENTEALKNNISFTENFHTEEKFCAADVKVEPKVYTYQAYQAFEEGIKSDVDTSCNIIDQKDNSPVVEIIKSNMGDAYMSNAKEELLESGENEIFSSEERRKLLKENRTPIVDESVQINGNNHNCKDVSLHDSNFNTTSIIKPKDINAIENCNTESRPIKKTLNKVSRHIKKLNESHAKKTTSQSKGALLKENSAAIGESSVGFDVYNIETAMPIIDLDAIENHLRAAREEERRRRNDREEIRRRLALGGEVEDFYGSGDRPGRKPSLQARLQSGMNLQICFMNDTASDGESPTELEANEDLHTEKRRSIISVNKDCDLPLNEIKTGVNEIKLLSEKTKTSKPTGVLRPSSLALSDTARPAIINNLSTQADFFACQARLQTEARMALAQAKEMAHIQMEIDRQRLENSPITEMLRVSLEKAGIEFFGDRRRVSRQMLTDMNIAQLQVIVNELHTQIEFLNESLVKLLIARDELHMGQDSMLVDIEDLTRHLGAKELTFKGEELNDELPTPMELKKSYNIQPRLSSLTSLLTK